MSDVAVVGVGAIGGGLAAELRAAGAALTLCVRTPFERLVVEREDRPRDFAVGDGLRLLTQPEDATPARWVLVTTKAQDTASAGPWLARLVGPETAVVVVQNGIEHRERVAGLVGEAPVLPGVIRFAVERTEPGRLVHRSAHELTLEDTDLAHAFGALFDGTVMDVVHASDLPTEAWRKLLSNLAGNPITALTAARSWVFDEPAVGGLARALLEEGHAIARADGAELPDDVVDRTLAFYAAMPPEGGSSMLYDRLAGRGLEYDALTGAVVRAAERHGVPAPLNRAVLALLVGLDASLRR